MVSDSESKKSAETMKFLCSYGGKIRPRSVDGMLRYVGGLTRVLAVDRSISFAELMVKLGEFCGHSVELRCQLPNGDLETLICIKSDEELSSLIEEYDRCRPGSKIRAILCPPKWLKTVSPPPSNHSSVDFSSTKLPFSAVDCRRSQIFSLQLAYPIYAYRDSGKFRYNQWQGQGSPWMCYDPCCYNWH